MQRLGACSLGFAACVLLSTGGHAETGTIIKPSDPNSLGLLIETENIPDKPPYVDSTYVAFKQFREKALQSQDYYQQLRIVPQVKSTFSECKAAVGIEKALKLMEKGLGIGTETATLVLLKVGIEARLNAEPAISYVPNATPAPLLMVGRGDDKLVPSERCFFDVTPEPTYGWFRYEGGLNQNYDDYVVQFYVSGGKVVKSEALGNLFTIFSNFNAAASWDPVSKDASAGILALAQSWDKAYSAVMGGPQPESTPKSAHVMQGQLVRATVPNVIGNSGTLVIYPKRYGSIIFNVNDAQISAQSILQQTDLTTRNCHPADVLAGKCNKHETVRTALRNNEDVKAADASLPFSIFGVSTKEKRKLIPDVCKAVKGALLSMGLSTLDEMMIRWAILHDTGLENALYDTRAATIEQDAGQSIADIRKVCWNDGDKKTVFGVASVLNKKLVD